MVTEIGQGREILQFFFANWVEQLIRLEKHKAQFNNYMEIFFKTLLLEFAIENGLADGFGSLITVYST
jgi:hypothetical protein